MYIEVIPRARRTKYLNGSPIHAQHYSHPSSLCHREVLLISLALLGSCAARARHLLFARSSPRRSSVVRAVPLCPLTQSARARAFRGSKSPTPRLSSRLTFSGARVASPCLRWPRLSSSTDAYRGTRCCPRDSFFGISRETREDETRERRQIHIPTRFIEARVCARACGTVELVCCGEYALLLRKYCAQFTAT